MAYSSTITNRHQKVRWILKLAGVPYYFATFGSDDGSETWDDSALNNSHGELPVLPLILNVSVSGGSLNYQRNLVTASTARVTLKDSSQLRTMFGRRLAGQGLQGAITNSSTSATIGDTSGYSADDYVWIGSECAQIDTVSSGTILSFGSAANRGVLGTVAQSHPQYTDLAASPRVVLHTKAWLTLGTYNGASWEYEDPFKVFYIGASPSFKTGQWELSLNDGLQYFDRKFQLNFPDVEVTRIYIAAGETKYRVYLADMRSFLSSGGQYALSLWMDYRDNVGCFYVQDIESDYVTIYGQERSAFLDKNNRKATFVEFVTEMQSDRVTQPRIDWLQDLGTARAAYSMMPHHGDPNPAAIALRVMFSDIGNGANDATYDKLPGLKPTNAFEPYIRAGAGLTTDEVDKQSWLDAAASLIPSAGFIVNGSGQEESLLDFLTRDIAPMLGGYVYVNNAGKLAFKKYAPATAATSADYTITDSNALSGDNAVDDESSIIGEIEHSANYSWAWGQYLQKHHAYFLQEAHKYRSNLKKVSIESRLAGHSHFATDALFESHFGRWGEGSLRHSVTVPFGGSLLLPGDNVAYTNSRLPDFEGGQGFSEKIYEVSKASFAIDNGRTSLELLRRPTGKLISPACELDANVTGTDEWTVTALYTSETIADEWAVGWRVQFIDSSGDLVTDTGVTYATIAALGSSPDSITFTSPPSGISAGDTVILAQFDDVEAITATNATSGATQIDHAYFSTESHYPDPGHKWA